MDTQTDNRVAAKIALKEALKLCDGDTNNEIVAKAIARLVAINTTLAPVQSDALQFGNLRLISAPNFPDGQKREDGKYEYTLGRLAFNIFEPTDLKLVIDRVFQPVFSLEEAGKLSHDIIVEFTIIDERAKNLQGIIKNRGQAFASDDRTLQVKFTGAELFPLNSEEDPQKMQVWLNVFDIKKRDKTVNLGKTIQLFLAKLLFGVQLPSSVDRKTGKLSFTMSRSPEGGLETIYLDSELRITRSTKKKTVLVCEKNTNE